VKDYRRLLDLPPNELTRLADALAQQGRLPERPSAAHLITVLPGRTDLSEIAAELSDLADYNITGRGAAHWLRTCSRLQERDEHTYLTWSGPEVPGLPSRDTAVVYEDLVSRAQRRLWICAFAYYDGQRIFRSLAARMDERPALEVILLLNIHRRRDDVRPAQELVHEFALQFWRREWPGTRRPAVYYDPHSVDPDARGVLHAKAVVRDEEEVFITSANLTEAAQEHNIELGVLLREQSAARDVAKYLGALIDQRRLLRLPEV
jgi:phosphatidylserine/phosphatidylglycerophosphate/cardiolipin synthase-like enzyme